MLTAGITGGIGSGKTTICNIFREMGIPVYEADTQAKLLMDTDPDLIAGLQNSFGISIFQNGKLDRPQLARIIFNNREALAQVNALVHPAVERDFHRWRSLQTSPWVLEETAIIYESGIANRFDRVILITAPIELRIKRVCTRDNITPDAVRARINAQWPDAEKIPLADYHIINDGSCSLHQQVAHIHAQMLIEAGAHT